MPCKYSKKKKKKEEVRRKFKERMSVKQLFDMSIEEVRRKFKERMSDKQLVDMGCTVNIANFYKIWVT